MKIKDLRNMTIEEIDAKERELKKELFNIKFQLHTGRLENTAKLSALRKNIARAKTVSKEKRA
ncbi:MAG: 50S ribosomal protein L29 [SAR324 cluster bacterium]|uniref:Large ribosomal subunit protein uL29 n=1 Tax=SAR324 cluster bacterium TaxID=2024889 RepID=A0A7X9II45_9DELT|nr:50S ribosomal protein L29 [SAR324 cluster bacterium]